MPNAASYDGPRGAPPRKDLPEAVHELLEGLWYANHLFEEEEDAGRMALGKAILDRRRNER
jgi:hypothetical protein